MPGFVLGCLPATWLFPLVPEGGAGRTPWASSGGYQKLFSLVPAYVVKSHATRLHGIRMLLRCKMYFVFGYMFGVEDSNIS